MLPRKIAVDPSAMFPRLVTTLAFALLAFAPIAAAKEPVQFYSPPSDITKQYIVKESSRFYIQWQTDLPLVELVAFHGPNAVGTSQVLVLACEFPKKRPLRRS